MAYSLPGERPVTGAFATTTLARLVGWLGKTIAARRQRIALATLLEFDEHRLCDLGVTRHDVAEAMRNPQRSAGRTLSAQRARNAARD